jgi:hypothetical protein
VLSGGRAGGPIKELAGFQHRVHDNGELTRHGNGGSLEADPLPELEAPSPQAALGRAAGQDDGCRLKEQPLAMDWGSKKGITWRSGSVWSRASTRAATGTC